MRIQIPNFFIVGAPKAGTTALYEYLRTHPNIFMPDAKEPHFFAKDFKNYPSIKSKKEYFDLFKNSTKEHLAIGEASVWYLYSEVALKLIYEFNSGAKIIAMLRNPVDLSHAMHSQALYNYNENEPDFEKAWKLQNIRTKENNIPNGCRAYQILQYKKLASLGYQVERLLSIFPEKQVKIIFFEEFIKNPKLIYEEVLKFLDVPSDDRVNFPKINESKTHKFPFIGWLTQTPPKPILKFVRFARENFGLNINKPLNYVRSLNDKPQSRKNLRPKFREYLVEEFRQDTEKLSKILQIDLQDWLH